MTGAWTTDDFAVFLILITGLLIGLAIYHQS
jgi:hypothetical protein